MKTREQVISIIPPFMDLGTGAYLELERECVSESSR